MSSALASSPALENDRRRRLRQARLQRARTLSASAELALPPLQIPNTQEGTGESEEGEEDEVLDEDPYQQERELARRQGESRRRQHLMEHKRSGEEQAGEDEETDEDGDEEAKRSGESRAKEQLQKELKEWILRYVNGAFGLTLVGLLVPFLTWNAQLITVNILKFDILPPLKLWETLACIILDGLLFAAAVILYLFFVILCLALFAPHLLLLYFGSQFIF